METCILISRIFFLIAFPILEALRDYWIFPVKIEVSKRWHSIGFVIRGLTAVLLIVPYYTFIPLYAFFFWIAFDQVTGVGHTAAIDLIPDSFYIKIIGFILTLALVLYSFT